MSASRPAAPEGPADSRWPIPPLCMSSPSGGPSLSQGSAAIPSADGGTIRAASALPRASKTAAIVAPTQTRSTRGNQAIILLRTRLRSLQPNLSLVVAVTGISGFATSCSEGHRSRISAPESGIPIGAPGKARFMPRWPATFRPPFGGLLRYRGYEAGLSEWTRLTWIRS